jgi:plastocyanin
VTFGIHFINKDSGVGGHDVDIRTPDAQTLVDNAVLTDAGEVTYVIPPLDAGTYTFICSIHPIANMTGTLTVR